MPHPNHPTAKTPVQISLEALNRKRKPMIDFTKAPLDEALKAKDAEIAVLTRQLRLVDEKLAAALSQIDKPTASRRPARQQVEIAQPTAAPSTGDGIAEED